MNLGIWAIPRIGVHGQFFAKPSSLTRIGAPHAGQWNSGNGSRLEIRAIDPVKILYPDHVPFGGVARGDS
jgi:hypothetical protein